MEDETILTAKVIVDGKELEVTFKGEDETVRKYTRMLADNNIKANSWNDMRRRIKYRNSDKAFDVGVVAMNVMDEHDEIYNQYKR